jgi:hypothetical protein
MNKTESQVTIDSLPNESLVEIWQYAARGVNTIFRICLVSKRWHSLIWTAIDYLRVILRNKKPLEQQIAHLTKFTNLRRITLQNGFYPPAVIPEEELVQLTTLSKLSSIKFENSFDLCYEGWMEILHGLPSLDSLSIFETSKEAMFTMESVLPTLTMLTSLKIENLPDLGITTVVALTNLQHLKFDNLGYTDQEMWDHDGKSPYIFLTALQKLRTLFITKSLKWEDSLTKALLQISTLQALEMFPCQNMDIFWEQLPRLTSIRHLYLWEFPKTLQQVAALSSLPNLQFVVFCKHNRNTNIFDQAQCTALKGKVINNLTVLY